MNEGLASYSKVISSVEVKDSALDKVKYYSYITIKRAFDIVISLFPMLLK